ncbi:hypothetical protein BAY61_06260 [Prauserella marina]|uniref:Uncharacterized protein n=1 Tax=Prauserella marina TaxID=530584 RepID=A0A222VLD5_9PSEU|nr:hypothetical protein [Prauserella marina]ASR34652.1 hypothetical protein BAY61_06260 [Prauserella marina]PWV85702.1 hypothetical protein DES30_1011732 [Prauserella marina]SDC47911.1 hypothetical protein SAMN05421630_102260 [Prauserella marina]
MTDEPTRSDRARRVERRLATPVVAAAVLSVPAVFLSTTDGVTAIIGTVLNWISLAVLIGETLVLLWLSGDALAWLRRYRWHLFLVGTAVPAVVFAIGPVQVLRLALAVASMQVLGARRIVRAGKVIGHKAGLGTTAGRVLLGGVFALATVFVAIVLSDPGSLSRRLVDRVHELIGKAPAWLTVLILFGLACCALVAGAVVRRRRRRPSA